MAQVDGSRLIAGALKDDIARPGQSLHRAGCGALLRTARHTGELRLPGRELGHVRYDLIAQGFGAYGEFVEDPRSIRPALERGMKEVQNGRPALINVVTEPTAMAQTVQFASYGG
jgi:thiamine pyrophosphate-dependent acetolactate synthase large subunit-like protein